MTIDTKTAAGVLAKAFPVAEPHASSYKRLSFTGLHRTYVRPTVEAEDLYQRLRKMFSENFSARELELMQKFHFKPVLYSPTSHALPHPPAEWDEAVRKLAEARAQELMPGHRVVDSWVFNLHDDLGVSVVVIAKTNN